MLSSLKGQHSFFDMKSGLQCKKSYKTYIVYLLTVFSTKKSSRKISPRVSAVTKNKQGLRKMISLDRPLLAFWTVHLYLDRLVSFWIPWSVYPWSERMGRNGTKIRDKMLMRDMHCKKTQRLLELCAFSEAVPNRICFDL